MKRTDAMVVEDLRRTVSAVVMLCKEARDRGITIRLWDGGGGCMMVNNDLKVIAERTVEL